MRGVTRPDSERLVAERIVVRGRVQGVGFRPHAARLAAETGVAGWVRNGPAGVEAYVEGAASAVEAFARRLGDEAPGAAVVHGVERERAEPAGYSAFEIRASLGGAATAAVSPDLATCAACLAELRDPASRFYGYPFLNCTQCGPRVSVVERLPYDRANTTLAPWPMCAACRAEFHDPADRRFHAQPTACPRCGPGARLVAGGAEVARGTEAIAQAAERLRRGEVVAVKGVGGYLIACDARNAVAVESIRARKGRPAKPFALMARDVDAARTVACVSDDAEALLRSPAAPIALLPRADRLPAPVAPERDEIGVMLPSAPVHYLLFDAGAPDLLVMTSGNRSGEPLAFRDAEALERLGGIADAVLVGERPVARPVDDSVVRPTPRGARVVRRARGLAPSPVARLPTGLTTGKPVLALGADLKNAPLLAIEGEAFLAPHVGDLSHYAAEQAFRASVTSLLDLYSLAPRDVIVAHDAHPEFRSTALAHELEEAGAERVAVGHHRAHVAAVLAERGAYDTPVVGLACDGAGWGDDGTVWGGEVFAGSLASGLRRVAHIRPFALAGGDAAARWPEQAAAGALAGVLNLPDLTQAPFGFGDRFRLASRLAEQNVRTVQTTSVGRLFDAAAALCGFAGEQTYEGQAAAWLEALARASPPVSPYPFPDLDARPLLEAVVRDRLAGRQVAEVALAFHEGLAVGWAVAVRSSALRAGAEAAVASGGAFLNRVLVERLYDLLDPLPLWLPAEVPVGDGGIALGQAALALWPSV